MEWRFNDSWFGTVPLCKCYIRILFLLCSRRVFLAHSLCTVHIFFFCPPYELKHVDLEGQDGLVEAYSIYGFIFVAENHGLVVVRGQVQI